MIYKSYIGIDPGNTGGICVITNDYAEAYKTPGTVADMSDLINTITIDRSGDFRVRPLSISQEFIKEFSKSIVLIYTNSQRENKKIAQSHEQVDKKAIYDLAVQGQHSFETEDIQNIGKLLKQSWDEKKKISDLVSTKEIDDVVDTCLTSGAYGAKLLGSGGCGFVCVIGNPKTISKLKHIYKDRILNFNFES